MQQDEIDRVAGEPVSIVQPLGVLLADRIDDFETDPDHLGPHVIDWDALEAERQENPIWRPYYDLAAA